MARPIEDVRAEIDSLKAKLAARTIGNQPRPGTNQNVAEIRARIAAVQTELDEAAG